MDMAWYRRLLEFLRCTRMRRVSGIVYFFAIKKRQGRGRLRAAPLTRLLGRDWIHTASSMPGFEGA